MYQLPETGFLRLSQIIGQKAVTEEEAARNRQAAKDAEKAGLKRNTRPKRPRPAIPAVVPVGKSCWWEGVKSGRFPKPMKLGNGRTDFWPVEIIRALVSSADRGQQ